VFEDKVNKFTYIILKSSNEDINSISVTTQETSQQQIRRPKGFETSIIDSSDENNFEIINFNKFPGNRTSDTRIYLNRNNGEIIVSNEFTSTNGSKQQTSIGGTCEKIDPTKKKF